MGAVSERSESGGLRDESAQNEGAGGESNTAVRGKNARRTVGKVQVLRKEGCS